jgi:hypothetical protein
VEEREPADSPGIGRCIERGERAAVMGTEQEGAFGTGGVEDGVEVLHPSFERGVMPHEVREAGASLVEQD